MVKITTLSEKEIEDIGAAFADYSYADVLLHIRIQYS